jgi:hypothetical protein
MKRFLMAAAASRTRAAIDTSNSNSRCCCRIATRAYPAARVKARGVPKPFNLRLRTVSFQQIFAILNLVKKSNKHGHFLVFCCLAVYQEIKRHLVSRVSQELAQKCPDPEEMALIPSQLSAKN